MQDNDLSEKEVEVPREYYKRIRICPMCKNEKLLEILSIVRFAWKKSESTI